MIHPEIQFTKEASSHAFFRCLGGITEGKLKLNTDRKPTNTGLYNRKVACDVTHFAPKKVDDQKL